MEAKSKYLDISKPPLNLAEKRGHYIYQVLVDRGHNMRAESAEFLGIAPSTLSDILNGNVPVTDRMRATLMERLKLTSIEFDAMSYVPANPFACERRLGKTTDVSILDFIKQPYDNEGDRQRMLWLVGKGIQHNITDLEELADFMNVPYERLFDLMAGDEVDDLWFSFACKLAFDEEF